MEGHVTSQDARDAQDMMRPVLLHPLHGKSRRPRCLCCRRRAADTNTCPSRVYAERRCFVRALFVVRPAHLTYMRSAEVARTYHGTVKATAAAHSTTIT